MNNLIIDDLNTQIAREVARDHDEFIFLLLEPYGITKENYREHAGRILILQQDEFVNHYYIDDNYTFSTIAKPEFVCDDETLIYKYVVEYKVAYIESMRGD